MNVSVIGSGYVGLVAAACFAEHGHQVLCCDINERRVAKLRSGVVPIYEPGLDALVLRNQEDGRLGFTTQPEAAASHAEVLFLAVGTPRGEDGAPDLRQVDRAVADIAPHLNAGCVVVNKSTVPVGTGDRVRELLDAEGVASGVEVASNPEFLKEGSAVSDFMKPDRVVIGADQDAARERLRALYEPFFRVQPRMYFMSVRSAELTKYASNAYLATRISFINDVANLCEEVGADVEEVRRGMGADARIGHHFLYPGIGYGGSCFPKDTRALLHTAREHGQRMRIVEAAEAINSGQRIRLFEKLEARMGGGGLKGKTITLWGLAFKPKTDDVREAPSLDIARALIEAGGTLQVCDPVATRGFMRALDPPEGCVSIYEDPYQAAAGADALMLLTEWTQYRSPNYERLGQFMKGRLLYDGRNQWERKQAEAAGFEYEGVGR